MKTVDVGIRPGEKIHEEMITETDSLNTFEFEKYYVITPSSGLNWKHEQWMEHFKGKPVEFGFKYNSGNNKQWLNVEELRDQIRLHVDPSFKA